MSDKLSVNLTLVITWFGSRNCDCGAPFALRWIEVLGQGVNNPYFVFGVLWPKKYWGSVFEEFGLRSIKGLPE